MLIHNAAGLIPIHFAWTPASFTWASRSLTRTSLTRSMTRHNRWECLAAVDVVLHVVLWRLWRCSPLETLMLRRSEKRLCRLHMGCFRAEHSKCQVVD